MTFDSHEISQISQMFVVGVRCTTTSQNAEKDIGALWARAGQAGLLGASSDAFAAYHDYELHDGGFTVSVTVGRAAAHGETPPLDHVLLEVPRQRCVHVATDGSIDGIREAWARVWGRWPDGGPRAFAVDIERWRMGADGQPVSADVYIGVKSE